MIAAEPHLVSPIQSGPFAFRPSGERRILLPQPTRDGCVLALVGPAHGLLRAHPPGLEVAPDCDQGHLQPIDPSDEGHDRGPRPQIKRELQLIRHPPHNQPPNTRGLLLIQQPPTDPPPPPLERQGPESALPIKSPSDSLRADSRQRSGPQPSASSPYARPAPPDDATAVAPPLPTSWHPVSSACQAFYHTTHYLVN